MSSGKSTRGHPLRAWCGTVMLVVVIVTLFGALDRPDTARAGTAPDVQARSGILIDRRTGKVLWSKSPDRKLAPASCTKIMTALLALERYKNLSRYIRVPRSVASQPGVAIGLRVGDRITVRQALNALMVKSANDAALTLASAVSGSETRFVRKMNRRAATLGLTRTHFVNCRGKPVRGHYMSARDLAKLGRFAMRDARFRAIVNTQTTVIRWPPSHAVSVTSHNRLLDYSWGDGIKTGSTKESKMVLVGSGRPGLVPLIVVTMREPTRGQEEKDAVALSRVGLGAVRESPDRHRRRRGHRANGQRRRSGRRGRRLRPGGGRAQGGNGQPRLRSAGRAAGNAAGGRRSARHRDLPVRRARPGSRRPRRGHHPGGLPGPVRPGPPRGSAAWVLLTLLAASLTLLTACGGDSTDPPTALTDPSAAPTNRAASPTGAAPPEVRAWSGILIERDTGAVLWSKAPNRELPPASCTKIMTALLVLERVTDLDAYATVPKIPLPQTVGVDLVPGDRISVREALYALMVKSANDAALTLASYVAGGEPAFTELMNARAAELGLRHTHFVNCRGAPEQGHYSSARDLATLGRVAMRDPVFRKLVSTKTAVIHYPPDAAVPVESHNRLLDYPWGDGIKTGATSQSGKVLVGSGKPGPVALIVVTMHEPTRDQEEKDALALFEWGTAEHLRRTAADATPSP